MISCFPQLEVWLVHHPAVSSSSAMNDWRISSSVEFNLTAVAGKASWLSLGSKLRDIWMETSLQPKLILTFQQEEELWLIHWFYRNYTTGNNVCEQGGDHRSVSWGIMLALFGTSQRRRIYWVQSVQTEAAWVLRVLNWVNWEQLKLHLSSTQQLNYE